MVKPEFIAVINSAIVAASVKCGVPQLPDVCKQLLQEDYGGGDKVEFCVDHYELKKCWVRVPSDFAVKYWDAITEVFKEVSEIEGVKLVENVSEFEWVKDGEEREIEITVEDGHWVLDEEWDWETICDGYEDGDPEMTAIYKAHEAKQRAERSKHWRENIIPIPPPSKSRPTELYLTMAYEPYDWIKNGEKVTEFREYCETWVKRILANRDTLKTVKFQRGYGGPGRPKPEQMIWTIKDITLYDIETRSTCDPTNVREGFVATHIAIDLGVRMDDIGPATQKDK